MHLINATTHHYMQTLAKIVQKGFKTPYRENIVSPDRFLDPREPMPIFPRIVYNGYRLPSWIKV